VAFLLTSSLAWSLILVLATGWLVYSGNMAHSLTLVRRVLRFDGSLSVKETATIVVIGLLLVASTTQRLVSGFSAGLAGARDAALRRLGSRWGVAFVGLMILYFASSNPSNRRFFWSAFPEVVVLLAAIRLLELIRTTQEMRQARPISSATAVPQALLMGAWLAVSVLVAVAVSTVQMSRLPTSPWLIVGALILAFAPPTPWLRGFSRLLKARHG